MKETQCILFVIQGCLAEQALEHNKHRLLYTLSHFTDSAVAAAFSSRREPKEVQLSASECTSAWCKFFKLPLYPPNQLQPFLHVGQASFIKPLMAEMLNLSIFPSKVLPIYQF